MNYIKLLQGALGKFYSDPRPGPMHLSLYMALFQNWNASRFAPEFSISRQQLMELSKIGSTSSYHRSLVALDKWGYLEYFPSNNAFTGSKVRMISFTDQGEDSDGYDPKLENLARFYHSNENSKPKPDREPEKVSPAPEKEGIKNNKHPRVGTAASRHPNREQAVECHQPRDGMPESHRPKSKQVVGQTHPNNEPQTAHTHPKNEQQMGAKRKHDKHKPKESSTPSNKKIVQEYFRAQGGEEEEGGFFYNYYQDKNWYTKDGRKIQDWKALAIIWIRNNKRRSRQDWEYFKPIDHLKTTKDKDYDQPL